MLPATGPMEISVPMVFAYCKSHASPHLPPAHRHTRIRPYYLGLDALLVLLTLVCSILNLEKLPLSPAFFHLSGRESILT